MVKKARLFLSVLVSSAVIVSILPTSVSAASVFSVPNAPASPASQGATSSALSVTWSPPSSGPTPLSYQVFVNDTLTATSKETFLTVSSLSPNTSYDVSVSACNGDGCSSVSDETTLSTKPSIASSVKAVAKDGGLQVSFTPSGGPLSLNHKVWYKPLRSGTWTEWTPGVSDSSGTLVSDLTNGASYSVKVESSNSSYSVFSLTVSASPAAVPSVPSLSHNQALSSVSSIATSWTASSANGAPITGYNLYRNGTKVTTANSTSYVFAGLAAGTTYALSAEACNSAGCSAKSQVLSVATKPAAPATLSGAPADGSVVLTFASSPSANVAGYTVFYKASTSSIWIEHTPGINDTSPTTVTGLINATTYQFKVSSLSTVGSTESRVVQAIPRKEPAGPIVLSRNPTQSSLELYWTTPVSNGSKVTSYEVYRNDVKIGSTTALTYVMSGLTAGTNYTYQVAACNASGCGVKSSVLTVPTKPLSPTGLSVAPASGRLALTWTNSVSPVVTSHNVFFRLSSSTAWVEWTSGTPDSSVTVVTDLKGGAAYSVKVTSCNASGCTDSVSATGSPRSTPDTPTLTLDSATNSSIKFSFTPGYNGGAAITSYELWSGGTKKATTTLAGWTFNSLTPLTSHSYSLKACNAAGCSDLSAAMSVTTAPLPPTGVTVTGGLGSATVVFVASPLASRHKVEYKLESATTWTEWTPDVSDVSPVVVTGLNPGVNYNFKVGSQGPDGPSAAYPVTSTVKPQGKPERPATSVFSRLSDSAALTKASLRWSAPANNGGSAITGFEITANGETVRVGSNVTTKEFAGLSAGRKYPATIKACNTHGCSEESVSLDLYTAPLAIDHSVVTADPDQTTVSLSWPASDAEALTGYKVRQRKVVNGVPGSWSPSAPTSVSSRASRLSASSGPSVKSTTYTLSGLSPNTSYEIQVAPYNSANSDATWPQTSSNTSVAVSTAPLAAPGAPSTVSVSPTDKGVSVSWTAPSNTGGSTISGYVVRTHRNTNGEWVNQTDYTVTSAAPLKYNVSSLVNGAQYKFTVRAINAQGPGTFYDPAVVATPRTIPGAPTGVTAVGGESKVTLSWTAPASNGGAPIDYYEVKYHKTGTNDSPKDFLPNPTGTTAVIEGLTNGTSYTFHVKAHNEAGFSGHTTKPATPTSTPGLPSGLAATADNSSIAFSWQPPTFTGGIAVTGYEVSYSESPDGPWVSASVTATSYTITGLTNGVPYYLRVAAKNSAGTGTPATLPNSVTPRTAPGAPTNVIGIPDNGKVTVSWDGPLESGGSDVTGYVVQFSSNAGITWSVDSSFVSSPSTSHIVTGLTNGVEYRFRVRARNAADLDSAQSIISEPYKPRTTPSQPGVVTGTASNTKVTLSWAAPSNNGGAEITDYIVEYTSDNGVTKPVFADGTRATTGAEVTGLTNGTAYKFRVKAVNEASISGGTATNWSVAMTPFTSPGKPSAPSGTAGNEQVLLTWTAPENGGSAITSYVVDYSANDGATWASVTTSSSPSHTVTGLQNGYSYIFRVTAQNAAGAGSVSDDSQAVTPRTVPSTPAAPTAEARNASALVSWSAPSDGGSAITDYEVQFSFNNGSSWTTFSDSVSTDNSTTVTGLTNGTKYVFRVRAINAANPSGWSDKSSVVTPYTSPGAPGKPTGTAKDASVTLTWTPAVNNGSTVSNHVVYYSVAGANDWSDGGSSGSLTTHTVTGLQNGTQYVFSVKAENAADFGPLSEESDAVKPFGKPGKPTVLEVTPGNSTLDLSWSAPSDDGGAQVEDYVLQFSMNNGSTWSTWALYTDPNNSTLTQHTLTGLINGNSYKLRVAAKNEAGVGEWSDESAAVKPRTSPLKPGKPVADPASEQIDLVWAAPSSDGGSDITDYRVQYGVYPVLLETDWQTFQDEEPSAALSAVVTGLQNGTRYVFRVAAKNAAGWSDYSLPSSITAPYTTPGKPSKPSGVSGSKQVTLNWNANADDGGDEVTDFKIQFKIANTDTWSDFTAEPSAAAGALVTGLTDGTQYVFRVAAHNEAGDSAWSDPSDPVTPYSKTSPPTWSTGSAADASVTIAWQEPSDLGGGSVSGYTLRYSSSAPSCDNGAWVTAFEGQPLLTKTVTGLTNGANYRFCVAAMNQAGLSLWSDVSSLYMPVTAPGLVVSPTTKIAPSSVEVSWTKPVSDGGSLITKYQVEYAESGEAWPDTPPIEVLYSAPLKTLVSGLENGTAYKFRIRAVSNHSPGLWSEVPPATPYTNPDAPTDLVLFARALEIEASWAAPTIDGGMPVTKYQVKYKPSSATESSWFSFETTSTSAVIPNLTRNTSYDVQIIALNPLASSALAGKVTTAAAFAPGAPTITSVERGYRFLTVTFDTPASDGGADITKYQYSINDAAPRDVIGSSASTTTFVIDKLSLNSAALLDDTSYRVKVRAYNAAKLTGVWSSNITQKTAGRPGVLFPVLSQAQPDDVSMHFTWPAIDPQGTAVTDYEYSTDDGATWNIATTSTTGTDVSATVTLTSNTDTTVANGTWYKVKWRAKNLVGYSDASIAYDVRPRTVPDAPTIDSSSGQNQRATLDVSQGDWHGGAPVENYEYSYRVTNVAAWGPWVAFNPTTTADTLTVTGLGINISYDFRVRTVNEAGPSLASDPSTLLTHDYPGAPSLDSYIPANNQITALFSIPDYNGRTPVENYQYSLDGGAFIDFTPQDHVINSDGSESGRLVFASPSGQWRTLKMRTINDVGPSPDSNVMSVIAAYPPSAPRSLVVSRNLASLSLSWQEPSDLGFVPILNHEYSFNNGDSWGSLNTTSISSTIAGLPHCTSYTLIIRAVNVAGNGAQSTPASNSTFCKPSTPAAPGVAASERKVTVSWIAPANGGTSITGYAIQRSTNGGSSWSQVTSNTNSTATSLTDSVSNNTAYIYRVAAINAVDTGTYSGASVSVTPVVPPPSGVTKGTVTASQASFSWNASGSAHLASSNKYRVYRGTTYIGQTNDTSFTATGLSENTAYTFYVYAVDNLDTWSSAASASITSGNTPIWATSASAVNNGAYYSGWTADYNAPRREINWALNPADGQNYSRTDVYVREYSWSCYCWGSWGLVGTANGSEAGVSGSFTQGGHVAVRPSYSYQTLLRVWDTYGGSNDYVYETATHGLDSRTIYTNVAGLVNNSAGEIMDATTCSAESTTPNAGVGASAWATCAQGFDRTTTKGWLSNYISCGTVACNSGHDNWWEMKTGDDRHFLGKNAYEQGYPQNAGSAAPSYTLTSVRIYTGNCHNFKVEIDYDGDSAVESYTTASPKTEYCAGWNDVDTADRGVRVNSDSDARWNLRLTVGNPRTIGSLARRVQVGEVQFGVSYWKHNSAEYR